MSPPETTPLAKAITTLEGQLVIASDVVLAVAAALPSHIVSPKVAAIVAGAQHVALLVQRGVIKAQASKAVGTIVNSPDPVAAALAEIESLETSQAAWQEQTGTPDHLVDAGLAPDVPAKRSHRAKPAGG